MKIRDDEPQAEELAGELMEMFKRAPRGSHDALVFSEAASMILRLSSTDYQYVGRNFEGRVAEAGVRVLNGTGIKQALLAMRSLGWISFEDESIPAMVGAIAMELDNPKSMREKPRDGDRQCGD